ncbi:MAG: DUF2007 domain-containing protein [Bacteroidaceae bacterium]|nr:DUF2007 domain-containing protein [Bacteroidaceae bacterium]
MKTKEEPLIVIATCNDLFYANIIAGKLEAEGINTLIKNCSVTACQSSPYDAVTGEFEVYVLESDKEKAEAILNAD